MAVGDVIRWQLWHDRRNALAATAMVHQHLGFNLPDCWDWGAVPPPIGGLTRTPPQWPSASVKRASRDRQSPDWVSASTIPGAMFRAEFREPDEASTALQRELVCCFARSRVGNQR
jgi:hypothetical protein